MISNILKTAGPRRAILVTMTVQYRTEIRTAIVDAASEILASEGVEKLTAGRIAERVGLARNSLYRYVESMDEVRALVVREHMPGWISGVHEAVDAADSTVEKILAYADENLRQAQRIGHAWLMTVAMSLPQDLLVQHLDQHCDLESKLMALCEEIDPDGADITHALVHAVIGRSFTKLEDGADFEQVRVRCLDGVAGLVNRRARA